ncbi:MAG: AsmA family protein [Marinifilaceae bacterium]|jgi:uncharacterized protein involved in outer membrane biogenesis|nr:AsmA family protein [Marinifilaceae bacterium]
MKRIIKILIPIILILIIGLLLAPSLYKGKILDLAKSEINKSINANLDIKDLSSSFFKSFPNLTIEFKDISLYGKGKFKGQHLIDIHTANITVSPFSIFSKNIQIKDVNIQDIHLTSLCDKEGKKNWDIFKKKIEKVKKIQDQIVKESKTKDHNYIIDFNKVSLQNLNFEYYNEKTNTNLHAKDIDIILKGNFSEESTEIDLNLKSTSTNIEQGRIKYLQDVKLDIKTKILAKFTDNYYEIKENSISINDIDLAISGSMNILKESKILHFQIGSKTNKFKDLLSIIPSQYIKNYKNLKTSGNFKISGEIEGTLRKNELPRFNLDILVSKGELQYPSLPEKVKNVNIYARLNNPGGDPNLSSFTINKFHLDIANNPIDGRLSISKPLTDMNIDAKFNSKINFTSLKRALPITEQEITGIIKSNIELKTKYSYIKDETYNKIDIKGDIDLKDFKYKSQKISNPLYIKTAKCYITSSKILIQKFTGRISNSDISVQGNLKNYIEYLILKEKLNGDLSIKSELIDFNKVRMYKSQIRKKESYKKLKNKIIQIPKDLNLKIRCNIKKIIYDHLLIKNTNGNILINDRNAKLQNISLNLLKGTIRLNGNYNTINTKEPKLDVKINANRIDLKSTYNSFNIIQKMLPMAINCQGNISMNLNMKASLNKEMLIIPNSINGNSILSANNIIISNNNLLDEAARLTNNEELRRIKVSKLKIFADIKNGNINIKPFKTKLAGYPAKIYGNQTVNGKINYTIETSLPKELVGKEASNFLINIPGYNDLKTIDIDILLKGDIKKPKVKFNFTRTTKQISNSVVKKGLNILRSLFD